MPTPSGVNYLLQSLLLFSNSPIIEQQESKVDVQSYVLLPFICPLVYSFDYTFIILLFLEYRSNAANVLSESQRLCHFKTKAKGTQDSEEHACTRFDTAILNARNV